MQKTKVYIGYDSRWPLAYAVTVRSMLASAAAPGNLDIRPLLLPHLIATGAYDRPMHSKNGQMHDEISGAPMATEFAISRFLIPYLSGRSGWSVFCDSDFLWREDIAQLLALADEKYAVMCVKHQYAPTETTKMNGQAQTLYSRKNWSSMMLINNAHPKNNFLNLDNCNGLPGRDLHGFLWLEDEEIGELPVAWNWLEGHSPADVAPKALHYTRGTPDMEGYADAPYADEWRAIAAEINLCKAVD